MRIIRVGSFKEGWGAGGAFVLLLLNALPEHLPHRHLLATLAIPCVFLEGLTKRFVHRRLVSRQYRQRMKDIAAALADPTTSLATRQELEAMHSELTLAKVRNDVDDLMGQF